MVIINLSFAARGLWKWCLKCETLANPSPSLPKKWKRFEHFSRESILYAVRRGLGSAYYSTVQVATRNPVVLQEQALINEVSHELCLMLIWTPLHGSNERNMRGCRQ